MKHVGITSGLRVSSPGPAVRSRSRRFLRSRAVALVVLAGMLALAACGGGGNATSDNGVVTLRMAWYGGEGRHKIYNDILDRFEQENPNIKVSRESAEFGAYWERLGTQAAARDLPDVLHFTNMQLREFATAGQLLDLADYTSDGTLDLADFDEQLIESGRVDGTLYAVPTGLLVLCTIANTTMLADAGVTIPGPDETWTWDEFKKQGQIAATALGANRWFTSDFGGATRVFKAYLMGRNKQLFNLDQDPPTLGFDRQDLVDWLTYWEELRKDGVAPPASVTAEQDGLPFEDLMFSKDQTAIYLHTSNTLTNHEKYAQGDLELRRMPTMSTDGPASDYYFSVTMAISANSEHPAEAAKLINYFMNDPEAATMYGSEFGPLASSTMRATVSAGETPEERKVTDFSNRMLEIGVVSDQAWPRGGALLNDSLLARTNEQVAFGQATPQQAADSMFDEAESVLS